MECEYDEMCDHYNFKSICEQCLYDEMCYHDTLKSLCTHCNAPASSIVINLTEEEDNNSVVTIPDNDSMLEFMREPVHAIPAIIAASAESFAASAECSSASSAAAESSSASSAASEYSSTAFAAFAAYLMKNEESFTDLIYTMIREQELDNDDSICHHWISPALRCSICSFVK